MAAKSNLTHGQKKTTHVCYSDTSHFFGRALASGDMEHIEGLTWKNDVASEGGQSGSGLRGYITTTFEDIVNVFGEPLYGPNALDGDITCEWELLFSDGTYADIYDYKTYDGTPVGVYDWRIGGTSHNAVFRVNQAFESVNKKVNK